MTLLDDLSHVRRWYTQASREYEAATMRFTDLHLELKHTMRDMPKGITQDEALFRIEEQGIEGKVWVERYREAERSKEASKLELDRAYREHQALRVTIERTTAEIYELVEASKQGRLA